MLKLKGASILALTVMLLFLLSACTAQPTALDQEGATETEEAMPILDSNVVNEAVSDAEPQIYLYGEMHGVETILNRELEFWHNHYHNENMRHLFIELPYYGAEFLNFYMQSDSEELLEIMYDEWEGTATHEPTVLAFYQRIKQDYPETIFHGTDVGHGYNTTGSRFLEYLEENGLQDTEQYQLAQASIEQGKRYRDLPDGDAVYRENQMVENFIREFDALDGESVMGIYGGAHTDFEAMDSQTNTVLCMAAQLKERYGANIHSEDLVGRRNVSAIIVNPIRTDMITVAGKEYEASYFGQKDIGDFHDEIDYLDFWRLENAYDDLKDRPTAGDVLPYDNYLMPVDEGEVFVIEFTKKDGSVLRTYYRSDGDFWEGKPTTVDFTIE